MKIINGDSLDVLKRATPNSIDAIVTDPPYGLSFMGKKWDYDVPSVEIWKECLRVLKPGGYLLSFAGTRTQHRMAVNIEDAGFEIRDMIAWVYGSGFPKSLNIGKAVDKLQGNEREVVGKIAQPGSTNNRIAMGNGWQEEPDLTKGTSEWEGWGTALKPALEPITVARKPLEEKTVAKNVLKHGTGGINIDGSRVEGVMRTTHKDGNYKGSSQNEFMKLNKIKMDTPNGRFPANLIHDGSDEVVRLFPGEDEKSASRFFYVAKASKSDRNEGLIEVNDKNNHPTVKPTKLMQYLVKLVTPKGGKVLDPFMGSGSTGKACMLEGFDFVGIDLDPEYCKIAEARIKTVDNFYKTP